MNLYGAIWEKCPGGALLRGPYFEEVQYTLLRLPLRNAVNQSLMSQDGTTNCKRDSMEGDDDTELTDGLKCAKRIKLEQADDEYSDEEEDIVAAVSKRGRSKPKQR